MRNYSAMSKANTTSKIKFTRRPQADLSVTIRRATGADEAVVAGLCRLDSRAPLPGPWLLGEVGGQALAVVSLATGECASDPFSPTQDLVDLLQARARHLRATRPARPRRAVTVFRAQRI